MIERVILGIAGATLAVYGIVFFIEPTVLAGQYGCAGPSQPLVGVIELSLACVCAALTIRRREPSDIGV